MSTDPANVDPPDIGRSTAITVSPSGSSSSTKALVVVLVAGIAGMVIFLFVHLSQDGRIRTGPTLAQAACTKGQRDCLPDINYVDTAGVAYSREALAGKVVLVNFWATWCHPCETEIPDLSRAYDKYKSKGVVFLGVMVDNPDSQQLLNFQSDHEMTYPIVRANPALMDAYNTPNEYPTTFIYDRSGKQVARQRGALRERELDSLLAEQVSRN